MLCPLCTFLQASLAPELNVPVSGYQPTNMPSVYCYIVCCLSVYAFFFSLCFPHPIRLHQMATHPKSFFFLND